MAQLQGKSSTDGGRLDGSVQKTTLAASHFALGAGWGGSSLTVTAGSTDQRGEIVITAATGGGLAQATATITMTYADGAYAAAPWTVAAVTSTSAVDEGHLICVNTTTTLTMTYSVLPVNTKVYTIRWHTIA